MAKGIGDSIYRNVFRNTAVNSSNFFGKIHTLAAGDTITLTTALGTRTYAVDSVVKVGETDTSGTQPTAASCVTLYTCVMDERDYRWCVRGYEI